MTKRSIGCALLLILAGMGIIMGKIYIDPIFVEPEKQIVEHSEAEAYKILFVGNSITRHGVYRELDWNIEAGMAASSEAMDYVHVTGKRIEEALGNRKVEVYYGNVNLLIDAETIPADVLQLLGSNLPRPDLVVIQTGEHEGPDKSAADVERVYEAKIIQPLLGLNAPMIATGNWNPGDGLPYSGWVKNIDIIYGKVCEKYGISFVSVEKYATDPSCRGYGSHDGVKWHPADKGMAGYAREILGAFNANVKDKINE